MEKTSLVPVPILMPADALSDKDDTVNIESEEPLLYLAAPTSALDLLIHEDEAMNARTEYPIDSVSQSSWSDSTTSDCTPISCI